MRGGPGLAMAQIAVSASPIIYRATFETSSINQLASFVPTPRPRPKKRISYVPRGLDLLLAAGIGLIAARGLVAIFGLDARAASADKPIIIQATMVDNAE